jgi:hypothetical protein
MLLDDNPSGKGENGADGGCHASRILIFDFPNEAFFPAN